MQAARMAADQRAQVERFVWAAGAEGDDEAHDGGDAGAVGARAVGSLARSGWVDRCG